MPRVPAVAELVAVGVLNALPFTSSSLRIAAAGGADQAKALKDRALAAVLIEVLARDRPDDLA
ncbi:hypothetical protein [Sediminimonas qiaohouensis]|uniref:hypothetical protein n=1 Tax=Sediminimonas qiaohouensis TaxID=552061 RepID=UPI0012ED652C|nr:hypothetical protein [Sediminimonas qiaohouensis]